VQGAVMAPRTAEGTSSERRAENHTLTGTFKPVYAGNGTTCRKAFIWIVDTK